MLWGQLKARPAMTGLHILLIAVGTAALMLVSSLMQSVTDAAERDARGIDLIVGPKGSPIQLVMAGVYHLDVPPGNIKLKSLDTVVARHPLVESVIPLSLGDSYAGARIVGTTPELIRHYGADFEQGELWSAPTDAVLGAAVAQRTQLQPGMTFVRVHGLDAQGSAHDDHPMIVVGVLKSTGTVLDRLILTSIESVWEAHGLPNSPESNETTLAIVKYKSALAAASVPRLINSTPDLQAASPALESARLLTIFGWIAAILRAFAGLVVIVAGISLFVALSYVLSQRMLDVAVVRALGARRVDVFGLLMGETAIVASCGVVFGFALARAAAWFGNRWLPEQAKLRLDSLTSMEVALGLGVIAFALLCTAWPVWRAYRADAAQILAKGTV
jgi:putative ABC transport system permease protein